MKYYRLLTSLPPIPEEISELSLSLEEIVKEIRDELSGNSLVMIDSLLWYIDTANAEAMILAKENFDPRGSVSLEDFENRMNLPAFLDNIFRNEEGLMQSDTVVQDLWQAYYSTLRETGEKYSSSFLQNYAMTEIGLRNAIAKVRSEKIGLDADSHMVESGEGANLYASVVLQASEIKNPLDREKFIDKKRLELINELKGIDSFSLDALLAYLAGAIILDNWKINKNTNIEKLLEVFA